MSKLQLPSVTLCCVDCIDATRAIKVLERCKAMCDFGEVKLLTSAPVEYEHLTKIKPLNSLVAYSIFMLSHFYKYINTEHVIIVQRDGFILNPESWNPEWLELDFIGPLYMQYDLVGSGGFSLRSKRIMEEVSKTLPEWDWTQKHADLIQKDLSYYEDGVLSMSQFSKSFKIASPDQAANWAQGGNRNPFYFRERAFGFHRTFQKINFDTGEIDSSDVTADITQSYDHVL